MSKKRLPFSKSLMTLVTHDTRDTSIYLSLSFTFVTIVKNAFLLCIKQVFFAQPGKGRYSHLIAR